ncbi:MAG: inositol 2-dehydrogenase [Christensenellaceae bacterium]|jgi:myo-inositol 2-dehydrogenase/D-chiro-inositol 1-dehydrogenase|nr:inositol 2-dehydrogenase [Christensenellaceae bacterium]
MSVLNIGIIGAGRIGKVHAESISRFVSDARIKSIADPLIDQKGIEWAKSIGISNVYKDYKEILNDENIDIVLICSPTDTHSQISIEAITKGKHVFCEKPVDHDVERIKAVVDALSVNSHIKYQVGFNRRFDHNFMATKSIVEAGKIGDLNILKITSRDPAAPPVSYIKVSGGIFLDMTIHDFDMVRFISDAEALEVYATGGVLVDKAIGEAGDVDTAVVTIKLSNGAIAVIDNCRRATYGYDQRIEAFGSLGQVSISNDTDSSAVISNASGVTAEKPKLFFLERYTEAYVREISSFIESVRTNSAVSVGIIDGLKPVLIGLAAKMSLIENRPVKLLEIEQKYGL